MAEARAWTLFLEPEDQAIWYGPFEVDGRSMLLQVRYTTNFEIGPEGHRNQRTIYHGTSSIQSDGPYFAVLAAETREVILPLDYNNVVVVPGRAVYVMTAEQLKKKSTFRGWHVLDVRTGTLTPSEIQVAQTYQPINERRTERDFVKTRAITSDPTVWPACLSEGWSRQSKSCTLTIVPPVDTGIAPTRLENVTTNIGANSNFYLGNLMLIEQQRNEQSTRTHLFNPDGSLWLVTDRPTRVFKAGHTAAVNLVDHPQRVLGTRAPGTAIEEDLWHLLGDNGEFGAPPGAIGCRPLQSYWSMQNGALGRYAAWLVRRDVTQVGGVPWIMVDKEFAPIDGAEYLDVRLCEAPWFEPPTNSNGTADRGNRAVLAVQFAPTRWELFRPGAQPSQKDRNRAPIATSTSYKGLLETLQQQVSQNEARYEKWEAARLAKEAEQRRVKLERDWHWALDGKHWSQAESFAALRSGDSYFELVQAVGDPTLALLDRAIAATSDSAKKAALQRRRPGIEQRDREDVLRAAVEQREQEARRKQSNWPSASSSGSNSGGGWSVSNEQKRKFRAAASFSPHQVKMGWQRPYDWR